MELPPNANARRLVHSDDPELYIWGTNVNINAVKAEFKRFMQEYKPDQFEEDEKESYEEWATFEEAASPNQKGLCLYMQRLVKVSSSLIWKI